MSRRLEASERTPGGKFVKRDLIPRTPAVRAVNKAKAIIAKLKLSRKKMSSPTLTRPTTHNKLCQGVEARVREWEARVARPKWENGVLASLRQLE